MIARAAGGWGRGLDGLCLLAERPALACGGCATPAGLFLACDGDAARPL